MKLRSMLAFLLVAGLVVGFSACDDDDDDDDNDIQQTGNVLVEDNITENTTWSSDKVYELAGRIAVEDGATLTIEAGTIIKGQAGTGPNATALLIARGGKLMAEGDPGAPIIFTSVADEITPDDVKAGNFGSPNLDPDINGLWGGVIILGKAPISASDAGGDVTETQIEGIPTSDQNGLYGGNVADDNSGKIHHISIRHGGANIGQGNEINGLSLGGVGSKTTIHDIEIVANQDDGIEWFGGTVDVENVVSWNVGDDGLDTDQSWAGIVSNFVIIAPTGHAFELDGPEGNMKAGHTIKNGTVVASDADFGRECKDLLNIDDNSIVDLENIWFTEVKDGQAINDISNSPDVTLTSIMIDVPQADLSKYYSGSSVPSSISAGGSSQFDGSMMSWTWAHQAGEMTGL